MTGIHGSRTMVVKCAKSIVREKKPATLKKRPATAATNASGRDHARGASRTTNAPRKVE